MKKVDILSNLVISQKSNNLLVNRYFVVDSNAEVEISDEDAKKEDFLNNFSDYKVWGRALLYPKGAKGKSIVIFNIDTDIDDIKEVLDEFLSEIRKVLRVLKRNYGFRYTASIEINNKLLRDIELNNDPMNIGHVLMNDNPSKQVTVMEKSAQMQAQPQYTPYQNQPMQPTTQPTQQMQQDPMYQNMPQQPNSQTYQEIEAPPPPQAAQTSVINAWRILPDGRLEVVPGYYVKPIEEPIVVDATTPQGDRYAPRNRYEVKALNPEGQVQLYSFIAEPDSVNRAISNIRKYTQEYQQYQQYQGQGQGQSQMPQQMPNIQSQALKNNKPLFKKAFQDVFVDERGVLRKKNGNPIQYPVGVKNSLSKLGDVYGLKYVPQRHEFIRLPENKKFEDARAIYLSPSGQTQGQMFPIREK